ncbi:Ankyrin repeats domain-containing protein [Phytophthora infestans]|uniref:Ankyrin repeats domain-containing protein n=1 Tax=Phytophthora infestans TaxID=4787 RepID=A0A8S9UVG0_PHYIN|nr:Ankyrin repeats domain-containing protein [Phytophthora infestans]
MPAVPPLTAVAYAFRTKPAFQGLPYVVDCVSVFLDSSVDLSLLYAVKIGSVRLLERIWTSSENLKHDPDHQWTLRKYLRTDKHYGQYLFSKGLEDAVPRQDMATIKWLLTKFQGFSISSEVVTRACKAGAMDLLQLFYENDSRVLEQRGEIGRGHSIKWGNLTMSAAVLSRRSDIVWWLHRHIPDANYDLDAALRSALIMGDIIMAEWLASHGARRSKNSVDITTRGVAANGRLDVLQWLVDKGRCKNIIAMVPIAAQNGHLEMLRWIVDWTLQKNAAVKRDVVAMAMSAIHVAATHGHLQTAKYLRDIELQAGCIGYTMFFTGDGLDVILCDERVSGKTMNMAAKKGFLDVVQWLYTEYGHDCQTDIFNIGVRRRGMDANAMDTAAKYGHLDVLKYFHELQISGETRLQCTKNAMDGAAKNGHLCVVKFLHDNRREGCTTVAMDTAAAHGHLDMVKWLHQYRTEGCTHVAMDRAASLGHIEVVEWLHENRTEGCTTRAMDNAATTGHLEMVKWLHSNRSEGCTHGAMDVAAAHGHLHVVKWLHSYRTEGFTIRAVNEAVENEHLKVVQWLLSNGSERCAPYVVDCSNF